MRHFIKKHKFKIAFTVPVILIAAWNLSTTTNTITLEPEKGRIMTVGDIANINLNITAGSYINAVGASVTYPSDLIDIVSIKKEESIFNLWAEEPSSKLISTTTGAIRLGGGTVSRGGYSGSGKVVTIQIRAKKEGEALMHIENASMHASDGKGTNVLQSTNDITILIEKATRNIYDLDFDGIVDKSDITLLVKKMFSAYEAQYDFDGDGNVNLSDLGILMDKVF